MLTYEQLIASVGAEKYWALCAAAHIDAVRPSDLKLGVVDYQLAHDISDKIWDQSNLPDHEKLILAFRIYQDMPCYAILMYVGMNYNDLNVHAKAAMWQQYRAFLDGPDEAHARPVTYTLWCDWFEDWRTEDYAWQQIVTPDASPILLRRVLDVSGPAPYAHKAALYERLIGDPAWHMPIFRSLLYSSYDAYGQIDVEAAKNVLSRLDLPPDTQFLPELQAALAPGGFASRWTK